jgi:subtilisin family serine protease
LFRADAPIEHLPDWSRHRVSTRRFRRLARSRRCRGSSDTDFHPFPWNVARIRADVAWREEAATGKGVVVAVNDTGLMVTPSLMRALWKNPRESFNDADDDGNGYVDDLFGYDFEAQSWYALGDHPQTPHGSACAGIIAGRPLNGGRLLTGVAPRCRLMLLRGMGRLKAYEYALENGADVLSLSFMWIAEPLGDYRGLYRLAHEHLAAGGIVAVGGAGNFRQTLPADQQIALPKDIPCVIAAVGVGEDGQQPAFSSEGPCTWEGVRFYDDYPPAAPLHKPDVSGVAGGYPVWWRPQMVRGNRGRVVADEGGGIGLVVGPQGNSFSGPHAAGVVALMFSVNPRLNAWEAKRRLESTCQDLGDPGWDRVFGHGLLDAAAAVRAARESGAGPP